MLWRALAHSPQGPEGPSTRWARPIIGTGLRLLAALQALHGKCSPPAAAPPAPEPPPMPPPPESAAAEQAEQAAEEERADGADWIDAAVADGYAAEAEEQVTTQPPPLPPGPQDRWRPRGMRVARA